MTDKTRKTKRVDAVLKVSYRNLGQLADYTENLSDEGLFIATEQIHEVGSRISFQLSFPDLVKPINLAGEVVWSRVRESLSEDKPSGIGVRLEFTDELESKWLRDLIGRLLESNKNQPTTDQAAHTSTSEPKELTVLLVEDNHITLEQFSSALESSFEQSDWKVELLQAETTNKASKILTENQIDLLIVESRLTSTDEIDLVELFHTRAEPPTKKPQLVIVGKTDDERLQAEKSGASVFIRRPVPAKGLIQTMKALFETF